MKLKVTHAGMWATREDIYDVDDDELIVLLKRALLEIREDQLVGKFIIPSEVTKK
jgi:hypothetical protein